MNKNELPAGWAVTTLGEVFDRLQYGYTAKAEPDRPGPKFLRITDIGEVGVVWNNVPSCSISHEDLEKYRLVEDDIVFARSGSIEKTWRVVNPPDAVFASYLIRGRPIFKPLSKIISHFLKSRDYLQQIWAAAAGSGMQNINAQKLAFVSLALPPLHEQKRIVKKIEELQARSKRAREALESVPALIEKFRQSVLAAAFRGDLTKEWREKNKDKIEPASELLKRIRIERRKKWEEEQLKKFQAAGKMPKDDSWKEKYKEPETVDTEGLPELPEGWCWATLDLASETIRDCPHSTPKYGEGDFFAIDTNAMSPGYVDVSSLRRVSRVTFIERTKFFKPAPGDVVFAREGTVGTAVTLPNEPEVCLGQRVVAIRPSQSLAHSYLEHCLNSPIVRAQYIGDLMGTTVNRINVATIVRFAIPVAPDLEQTAVLQRLGKCLVSINQIDAVVRSLKETLQGLDQSILAKAFRGELVPQDSNDEPAAGLLARIKKGDDAKNPKSTSRRGVKQVEMGP